MRKGLNHASLMLAGLALLALHPLASMGQTPDSRGEAVTIEPSYRGERATAPIPARMHVRNEGGSDGQGLCVIASILANGQYQGVPGLDAAKGSALWQAAKRAPGGYYPEKLESLVNRTNPGEKWASYLGRDPSILDRLSRAGYPIGATMNTGQLYGYRPIHHMVSLVHYRSGGMASVVDNNDPGKFHWMPAQEFDRRWVDGSTGWAWIWTRLPFMARVGISTSALMLAGASVLLIVHRARVGVVPLMLVGLVGLGVATPSRAEVPAPSSAQATLDKATALVNDPAVPAWLRTWGMPRADSRGRAFFVATFSGNVEVWARPKAWGQRIDFPAEATGFGAQNFGVSLGQATQAPGTLVTNDPDVGAVAFGQAEAEQCPVNPPAPDANAATFNTFIVPALIVGAGILIAVKARK